MTVFATPGRQPVLLRHLLPAPARPRRCPPFRQVLAAVSDAWANREPSSSGRREMVEAISARLDRGPPAPLSAELLDGAAAALAKELRRAVRRVRRRAEVPAAHAAGSCCATTSAPATARRCGWRAAPLEAMARGGIYDQLAGGFARYSVDAHLDRAALREDALRQRAAAAGLPAPVAADRRPAGPARVADETAAFLLRDLGTPEGGFASALDADTDGVEGLTYVWTPAQLVEVLGPRTARWAAELLRGHRPRHLRARRLDVAADCTNPTTRRGWPPSGRGCSPPGRGGPQPARDDKVVAAWNGLAITALAEHGVADRRRTLGGGRASRRPSCWPARHWVDGRLRRVSRDGVAGAPRRRARGLRRRGRGAAGAAPGDRRGALAGPGRGPARRRRRAVRRRRMALARHRRRRRGAGRTGRSIPADGPTPAGIAAAAGAASRTRRWPARRGTGSWARRRWRRSPGWWRRRRARPAGRPPSARRCWPGRSRWPSAARPGRSATRWPRRRGARPARARSSSSGSRTRPACRCWPDRPLVGGAPAAYVCRGFVCSAPVTDVSALSAAMTAFLIDARGITV